MAAAGAGSDIYGLGSKQALLGTTEAPVRPAIVSAALRNSERACCVGAGVGCGLRGAGQGAGGLSMAQHTSSPQQLAASSAFHGPAMPFAMFSLAPSGPQQLSHEQKGHKTCMACGTSDVARCSTWSTSPRCPAPCSAPCSSLAHAMCPSNVASHSTWLQKMQQRHAAAAACCSGDDCCCGRQGCHAY